MTELHEIYKCNVCGNMVEIISAKEGTLVCCGQNMELQEANIIDASKEKHVPVVEKIGGGYLVKIGSMLHPMTQEHHIEWIELLADGIAYRQFLKPGDQPQAYFCVNATSATAKEYCNLHGLWQKD